MIKNLEELVTKFEITDFKNVEVGKINDIIGDIKNIDKEVFMEAMKVMPQISEVISETVSSFVTMVEIDSRMSADSKKFYTDISERILGAVESESVPDDIKRQLADLLPEVMTQMKALSTRDYENTKENRKVVEKVFKGVIGILGVVAVIAMGGRVMKK